MAFVNFTNLTDWQYDTTAKQIKHNTGTTRYTVNALYSEIMAEFAIYGQMDDTVPMSAQTPTEYSLINGWTFSADTDLGYLYGGSIVVQKSITDKDVWANFYTLGTIDAAGIVYWYQNGAAVSAPPGYTAGHVDMLIKVVSAGANISTDSTALAVRAYLRHDVSGTFDLYDNFLSTASATGGRNPIPLATSTDTNDDYAVGSVVSGVTITFGTTSQDIGDGAGAQNYDVLIDGGGNSVAQVYKYLKYWTRRGNSTAVGTGNATQAQFYRLANAAYLETKQAPFGTFAGSKIYGARGVYITNVSDPTNRVLIDAANNLRTPPTSVTATITGLAVGDRVLVARLFTASYTLNGSHSAGTTSIIVNGTIAAGTPQQGTLTISGTTYSYSSWATSTFTLVTATTALYSTGTAVSLAAPNKTQFTLNGSHTSGMSTITVNETVGLDIPLTGVIRIADTRYSYTSLNRGTKVFTISGTIGTTFGTGTGAYVPLIDDVVSSGTSLPSPAIQYVADINIIYRVRHKGILPFENTGTVTNTGFTAAAIRTTDTIAV